MLRHGGAVEVQGWYVLWVALKIICRFLTKLFYLNLNWIKVFVPMAGA